MSCVAQVLSAHNRWQAFRGESTDTKQLLFRVNKSGLLFIKAKLDVFLVTNTKEEVADFKIEDRWLEKSCVIYNSNSTEVAKIHCFFKLNVFVLMIYKYM